MIFSRIVELSLFTPPIVVDIDIIALLVKVPWSETVLAYCKDYFIRVTLSYSRFSEDVANITAAATLLRTA